MMNLLLVTDHFAPGRSSGARLMTELALGLAAGGIEVSVISARERSAGRVGALRVCRIPLAFGRTKQTWLRTLSEILFSLGASAALAGQRRGRDHALILGSPPFLPLFAGPVARALRLPYSVVLMDVYPDMAARLGFIDPAGTLFRVWSQWLIRVLERAAGVVVIGSCMKEIVEAKCKGVEATVIPNWVSGVDVAPVPPASNPYLAAHPELINRFVVLYAGNMGLAQNFEPVLGAAELARGDESLVFALIGDGVRRGELATAIRARGLTNVHLYPFVDPALQGQFLSTAGVALITLEPGLEGLAVPSKFYPIMAAGRPVIAMIDPASEVGRTIERFQLGIVLQQPSASKLHEAIGILRARAGREEEQRIRTVFETHYDAAHAIARYREFLAAAAGGDR